MKKAILAWVMMLTGLTGLAAVEWKNLDDAHRLCGRKTSSGYLAGKVVMVDRWGVRCPPCRALLPRVEQVWQSFKTKPFVVLGGHCAGWGTAEQVKALADENKLTYSIYEDAGLAEDEPKFNAIPFLYVVDATGRVVYQGHDDKAATEAVVQALTDLEAPKSLEQYKRYLDFEFENLPGRAYLRFKEFLKKHPKEAKEYEAKARELAKIPEIKKLAEFVAFAKESKDMRTFDPKKQQAMRKKYEKSVKDAISSKKYLPLLDSKDPRVVQEAKNAFADLKWTAATF